MITLNESMTLFRYSIFQNVVVVVLNLAYFCLELFFI